MRLIRLNSKRKALGTKLPNNLCFYRKQVLLHKVIGSLFVGVWEEKEPPPPRNYPQIPLVELADISDPGNQRRVAIARDDKIHSREKERRNELDEYFIECVTELVSRGAKVNSSDFQGTFKGYCDLCSMHRNDSTSFFCNEGSLSDCSIFNS
jgi:hypothetical protein